MKNDKAEQAKDNNNCFILKNILKHFSSKMHISNFQLSFIFYTHMTVKGQALHFPLEEIFENWHKTSVENATNIALKKKDEMNST